jgi:hypothetical protein
MTTRKERGPNQGPSKDELRSKVEELTARLEKAEKRGLEPKPEVGTIIPDESTVTDPNAEQSATPPLPAVAKSLPRILQERMVATEQIVANTMAEIEAFKSGQAYIEGDLPVFLHGLAGPGFTPGQRQINWINPGHIDPQIHMRWSNKLMVDFHRADGYRPIDYAEFQTMTKARGGNYTFQRTPEGHVQCGDLVMVITSKSWYEQLQKRNRDKTRRKEGRVKDTLRSKGKELGMEVDDGASALGPKVQRLLDLLEKQLGPEAKQLFAGA